MASGWAIARAAQDHARKTLEERGDWMVLDRVAGDPSRITTALVAEAAQAGDAESASILARAHAAIAFALVQAITLVAPRRIVMGGGVSLIGEAGWFDPIRRLVEQDVFPPFRGGFDIVPAALGEEVVVHGALALARDAVAERTTLRSCITRRDSATQSRPRPPSFRTPALRTLTRLKPSIHN